MEIQTHLNAFSTSFSYNRDAAFIDGCLYDEDGSAIELSFRRGGMNGDRIRDEHLLSAARPASSVLKGRSIYLGNWMGHYGHFLLESLSRMWAVSEEPFDYYVFQPFIFGRDVHEWQIDMLKPFGIDRSKLVILKSPLTFEQITVPEPAFIINHSADLPAMRSTYSRLSSFYAARPSGRRLFLSRSQVGNKREAGDSEEMERLFSLHGFEIIHPQTLSIKSQIEAYQSAEILAGFSGSALHNVVLCRAGTQLIDLGDSRSKAAPLPSQRICNQIAGAVAEFMPPTLNNGAIGHDSNRIAALIS